MDATIINTELEEQIVNEEFQKLIDAYLASKHRKKVEIITKAFNFAKHAHKGVRRLSGEPYIMHPISVAQIVCMEIGLGSTSICAALLHSKLMFCIRALMASTVLSSTTALTCAMSDPTKVSVTVAIISHL